MKCNGSHLDRALLRDALHIYYVMDLIWTAPLYEMAYLFTGRQFYPHKNKTHNREIIGFYDRKKMLYNILVRLISLDFVKSVSKAASVYNMMIDIYFCRWLYENNGRFISENQRKSNLMFPNVTHNFTNCIANSCVANTTKTSGWVDVQMSHKIQLIAIL